MNRSLILWSFLLLVSVIRAQDYYDDAQVWLSLDMNKELNKHFDVRLKLQSRFTQNSTVLGRYYGDIGFTYKLNKHVRFLADYVLGKKRKLNGDYKTRHVFFAAIILKQDFRRWRFAYRNMFQARYVNPGASKTGYDGYYFDRNKIDVRYDVTKRFSVYVAEEINIPLNDPKVTGIVISRSRSYFGTIINLTKSQQLDLYFMLQTKYLNNDWFKQEKSYPNSPLKRYYVYGITYKVEF